MLLKTSRVSCTGKCGYPFGCESPVLGRQRCLGADVDQPGWTRSRPVGLRADQLDQTPPAELMDRDSRRRVGPLSGYATVLRTVLAAWYEC
jgi:hypothetical protein